MTWFKHTVLHGDVAVQAKQFHDNESAEEFIDWVGDEGTYIMADNQVQGVFVASKNGVIFIAKGDWLVRDPDGDYYMARPDIVARDYREVNLDAED